LIFCRGFRLLFISSLDIVLHGHSVSVDQVLFIYYKRGTHGRQTLKTTIINNSIFCSSNYGWWWWWLCQGGCVDTVAQPLSCVLMALGEQDVSKVLTGPLSDYT